MNEHPIPCLNCGHSRKGCEWCEHGYMTVLSATRWHARHEGRPPPEDIEPPEKTMERLFNENRTIDMLLAPGDGQYRQQVALDQRRGFAMGRILGALSAEVEKVRKLIKMRRA